MREVEEFNDYRSFCPEKLVEVFKKLTHYSAGEILQSVKHHLRNGSDKSFYEATDAEIYRAICITEVKEQEIVKIKEEV